MRINDKRVPADFALAIMENRNIEILSNGAPTRTFCYIADSINGYLKILVHGSYDYFNIGIEAPEISISRLAEIYVEAGKKIFGYTGKVVYATSHDKEYLTIAGICGGAVGKHERGPGRVHGVAVEEGRPLFYALGQVLIEGHGHGHIVQAIRH